MKVAQQRCQKLCGGEWPSAAADWSGGGGGAGRKSVLTLYADLGAELLREVLGSLCALAVHVRRVTAELKKEESERKRNAY